MSHPTTQCSANHVESVLPLTVLQHIGVLLGSLYISYIAIAQPCWLYVFWCRCVIGLVGLQGSCKGALLCTTIPPRSHCTPVPGPSYTHGPAL